jgi:hypothetical protein
VRGAVGGAVGAAVRGAVHDAVGGAVDDAVRRAVDDAVGGAVRGAVGGAVDDAVDDAVGGAVRDAVDDAVRGAVGGAVRGAVGIIKKHIYNNYYKWLGGQLWVGGWHWGSAYVTFFRDVCDLDLPQEIWDRSKACEDINSSACYSWPNKHFVMVCERPSTIRRDNNGRLHCENGASIAWVGFELFHWHGVAIPKEWVSGKPPKASDALTWNNIEQRRAACEIVGWTNILKELNAKVINTDGDPEIGTLLEAEIPDSGKERFLQVKCGTGRDFVLPVPRNMKTAIEANAWTYGLDVKDFQPEVRT